MITKIDGKKFEGVKNMKLLKKSLRLLFFSNLAVMGTLILLPTFLITGDLEIYQEFIEFLNKD